MVLSVAYKMNLYATPGAVNRTQPSRTERRPERTLTSVPYTWKSVKVSGAGFVDGTSIDGAENNLEITFRPGTGSDCDREENIGYSVDGGGRWQTASHLPRVNSSLGQIAVSADGGTWVFTPEQGVPYVTRDRGATRTEVNGLPADVRVIADRVNSEIFYGLRLFDGDLFVSRDGGRNFERQALQLSGGVPKQGENHRDIRRGQDCLHASPAAEGDLWIAAIDGLYHSTDFGNSFARMVGVNEIQAFGFGKAAAGADYPALFLAGVVEGIRGVFRSEDGARRWARINDNQQQWGLILHVTGDPKRYGRVYVGTHGRGTFYGDPVVVNT